MGTSPKVRREVPNIQNNGPSVQTRVELLEHRVENLHGAINGLTDKVSQWMDKQNDIPRPIAYKEIIGSIAATLAAIMVVVTVAGAWIDQRRAVLEYRMSEIERMVPRIKLTAVTRDD